MAGESGEWGTRRRCAEDARERERSKPRSCLRNGHSWLLPLFFFSLSSCPTPAQPSFIIQKVNLELVESDLFTEGIKKKTAFMTSGNSLSPGNKISETLRFSLKEPCTKYSDCYCDSLHHKYSSLKKNKAREVAVLRLCRGD